MNRWSFRLLFVGVALALCAPSSQAGKIFQRMQREKQQHPPRYVRGTMQQNYVFRDRDGNIKVREVYPGYAEKFPAPAMFFYGYPHSGYFTGLGIDGSP